MIVFKMKSGGQLTLTPNHPILNDQVMMVLASDYQVGDNLVLAGGKLDPIVSADHTNYYGKVYNVLVKTNDPKRNVVITNGYLNGTAYFQNDGAIYVNRALFRKNLTRGAFDQ
jgi:hypothetical protein